MGLQEDLGGGGVVVITTYCNDIHDLAYPEGFMVECFNNNNKENKTKRMKHLKTKI